MTTENTTAPALSPEFQALITRVQEIGKKNHEDLVAENRKMMAEALGQVSGGFKAPIPADVVARATEAGAAAGKSPEQVSATLDSLAGLLGAVGSVRAKATEEPSILVRLGILRGYKPAATSVSRAQALGAIAALSGPAVETARTEGPEAEILAQAMLGLAAFGVEQAHRKGLIEQPRKGMPTWQIVALSLGGVALAGGAVAGGMYAAEVGPFAPAKTSR